MPNKSKLSNYMGKNYKSAIAELNVVSGTAKDSGNVYYCIEINFVNGYSKRIFLRSEEEFAWTNAFDVVDTQKVIDTEF